MKDTSNLTKEALAELEEKEFKAKKRMLGNIKFIGELYLTGMLSEKIMHTVLQRLLGGDLKNPPNDSIEACSNLLTTIGSKIDHEKGRAWMDEYFKRLTEISVNKNISSRIRFMVQDILSLRKNKWISRGVSQTPPTTPLPSSSSSSSLPPKEAPRPGKEKVLTRSPSEEWQEVPSKRSSLPSKSPALKPAEGEIKSLRPQGVLTGSQGAKGWAAPKSKNEPRREESKGELSKLSVPSSASNVGGLKEEELEEKTTELLEEYYVSADSEEALTCIKELNTPSFYPQFILLATQSSLEKKTEQRELLAKLLTSACKSNLFSTQVFLKGWEAIFGQLQDMTTDLGQRAPQHLSEILAQCIVSSAVSLSSLASIGGSLGGHAADFLGHLLSSLADLEDEKLKERISESSFDITAFLEPSKRNPEGLKEFLESKNLDLLL